MIQERGMANNKREVLEQVGGVVIPDVGGELIIGSWREGRGYRESQQTLIPEDNACRAMIC